MATFVPGADLAQGFCRWSRRRPGVDSTDVLQQTDVARRLVRIYDQA